MNLFFGLKGLKIPTSSKAYQRQGIYVVLSAASPSDRAFANKAEMTEYEYVNVISMPASYQKYRIFELQ